VDWLWREQKRIREGEERNTAASACRAPARIGGFQRGNLGKAENHEVLVVQNIFRFAFKEGSKR